MGLACLPSLLLVYDSCALSEHSLFPVRRWRRVSGRGAGTTNVKGENILLVKSSRAVCLPGEGRAWHRCLRCRSIPVERSLTEREGSIPEIDFPLGWTHVTTILYRFDLFVRRRVKQVENLREKGLNRIISVAIGFPDSDTSRKGDMMKRQIVEE